MTAFVFNVAFDCADPRQLAEFWANVTGYSVVEAHEEFVRLRSPDKRSVRHLLFFKVPEPKVTKNRVHVDLATREPEMEIRRLLDLGASLVDEPGPQGVEWRSGNGTRWVVMRDPEGNEFCIG
jgi:catechol 2,3-dioxygenase-like lactoylglutathione lyase family enzyme